MNGRLGIVGTCVWLVSGSVAVGQNWEMAPVSAGNPGKGGFVSYLDSSKLASSRVSLMGVAQPPSWDWRTSGTTPVQNQGSCGSCWIFAGYGDLESKEKIATGLDHSYSEQEVLDCNKWGANCLTGGNAWGFFSHLNQNGTVTDADYPYTGVVGPCQGAGKTRHTRPLEMRTLPDDAPGAARSAIKSAIMAHGLVYCSIYAEFDQFQNYFGQSYGMYFPPTATDHAICLVGWDDSKPYFDEYPPNLGDPAGYGCWIIRNSWGTYWGQGGYGYVGYGAAGVATNNSYISSYVDASVDYGNILRYDHGYSGQWGGYPGAYTQYYAVQFFSTSTDMITGIGLWIPATNFNYQIDIYDDATPSSNVWTTLLISQTETRSGGGYHMVELTSPVAIPADDDFWVRVRVRDDDSSNSYLIPGDSSLPRESGRCYISVNSWTWSDASVVLGCDVGLHARLGAAGDTPTPTPTLTPTLTPTPTVTRTPTITPTWTPAPALVREYEGYR